MATHPISGQSDPTSLDGNFVMLPDQNDTPEIFRIPSCNNLNLHEISVDELQHHYASGALSASAYVKFCLDRIQKVHGDLLFCVVRLLTTTKINPYLECVIETNPDALEHAAALDEERRQRRVRGPLHGVPVLIKDVSSTSAPTRIKLTDYLLLYKNIATADKMQTTAGSWALLGCIVPKDAQIVHLLRESGAIIIGKSNLDEWAGMRGSVYALGYSARGGQTRNPYMLNRSASRYMSTRGQVCADKVRQMAAAQAARLACRPTLFPSLLARRLTVV
jgi:amidase